MRRILSPSHPKARQQIQAACGQTGAQSVKVKRVALPQGNDAHSPHPRARGTGRQPCEKVYRR